MDNAVIIWCHKAKSSGTTYEHLLFLPTNSESYPVVIHSDYLTTLSSTSYTLMGLMANLTVNLSFIHVRKPLLII